MKKFILSKLKILIKISNLIIFFPLILIFLVIEYFFKIKFRVEEIRSDRIGHFSQNVEVYLYELHELKYSKVKFIDFIFLSNFVSNAFLLELWKKKIIIFPRILFNNFFLALNFFTKIITIFFKKDYNFRINTLAIKSNSDRKLTDLYSVHKQQIHLTDDEMQRGYNELKNFSKELSPASQIVLLNVRDSEYLRTSIPNTDWSYHNFRDDNILDFLPACNFIASKNYYVFRMGKISKVKINSKNQRIIDYSFSENKSDFMDVFLAYICKFCFTTFSGYDGLTKIFRKKLIGIPSGNIAGIFNGEYFFSSFSHYYSTDQKKKLSISEIFENGLAYITSSEQLEKKRVNLIKPSAEELVDLISEFLHEDYKKEMNSENKLLHQKFWDILNYNIKKYKFQHLHHNYTYIKPRVSFAFLKKNTYFLN
jgi:putative glycosyltransferase (TIGR04372 family)